MSSKVLTAELSHVNEGIGQEIFTETRGILQELEIQWLQDYNEALERAAITSGSPLAGAHLVMAAFVGSDWCPYCKALASEVFHNVKFELWFNVHLMVPLMLDYPHNTPQPKPIKLQNAKLLHQYNVTGFPTVIAIKASEAIWTPNGKCSVLASEVGRVVGYAPGSGVKNWIDRFTTAAHIR